jgi:hypothetical protein
VPNFSSWNGAVVQLGALGMAVGLVWIGILGLRRLRGRATPAVWVAALAAIACTAYSADTSWRFAAHYLDMGSTVERIAMFGAAELALFANSLLARQNLHGPNGTPGAPGILVWVITGVQIIPAFAESGIVGGTVRAFVGPVMAALLWHLAMGIELRHSKPGAESHGLVSVLVREIRERALSRFGIAERDRDAAQITRDRATIRAVALASRLAEMDPEHRGGRRDQRLTRRLAKAVARASVGIDRDQRRKLLDQLAVRRHAAGLATVQLASPWDEGLTDPASTALAAQARLQMRQATEEIRSRGDARLLFADIDPALQVNTDSRSPEHPDPGPEGEPGEGAPPKLSTQEAQAVIEEGWLLGLTVRETASRATRAISFVHGVFTRLESERGPRPVPGQLALVNGFSGESHDD